ncbi:hypothetical protein J7M02_02150 [Candidatus Aerophobetes bacterium]|nr:hypothetical protein [Candidatus Aerophobetes bacterium]
MGGFEELGKKLDKLAEQVRITAQGGIEKTAEEAKQWGKHLDELGEKIKKTAQEGLDKFTVGTKELGQIAKLRSGINQKRKEKEEKIKKMGQLAYKLNLGEKVDDEEFKKITKEIADLEKDISDKEKEIENLRAHRGK